MLVSALEGHGLWASTYDSGPNPLLALESRVVTRLLNSTIPARFIDVACGTGRWMRHFHELGACVFGIDACSQMLIQAEKHGCIRASMVLGCAETLPFDDSVADLALCSFAASYIRDFPRVLAEMARVCARGARVVISDMHPLAVAAGWSRSFRVGTSTYELEHFEYSVDQMRAAGQNAGLEFQAHCDAYFDKPEHCIFERAGKKHLIPVLSTVPAVWVGAWKKP